MKSFSLRLTLVQFFLVFACALFSFSNLTHWDGEWYRQIVEIGYSAVHSADPFAEGKGNVGFFPGYPLLCYFVKKILGLGTDGFPTTGALLIVSNLFAILTWVYIEKWLKLFQVNQPRAKMLFLAIYPFTFFFYLAYTESVFTSMLIGFVYYSEKLIREEDRKHTLRFLGLAFLHAFWMDFTRLLGVVILAYPILRSIQVKKKYGKALLAASGGLLSPLVFFAYCQMKFGAWDFYFITERAIWGTYVDWGRLFPPKTLFDFSRPLHANTVSKYLTILSGTILTWKLFTLLRRRQFQNPALATVLVCGMMWGEYFLGRTSWDYAGMGRYIVPVIALFLPFFDFKPKKNWKWALACAVLIGFQIAFALKFGRHGWVA